MGGGREEFKVEDGSNEMDQPVEVDEEEIREAIKCSKNGKAPGSGGIVMELINHGGPRVVQSLKTIMTLILKGDEMPEDFRIGYISSIHKKGDRSRCSNYRGICNQSTVARIFSRVLKNRLEKAFVTPEEQSGFTIGRSCVDNIFVLRQLLEKCKERNKDLYMLFIDLEKAYDHVPRSLVWSALKQAGIEDSLIEAVKIMYNENEYQVKKEGKLSEFI